MKRNHVFQNKKVFSKNIYLSKSWKYFEYTPVNLISFTAAFWALKKSTSTENMVHNKEKKLNEKFTKSIQEGTYWDWSVSWNPFLFKNLIEAKVSNTNMRKLRSTLWQQCLSEKFAFYFLFCIMFPRFWTMH